MFVEVTVCIKAFWRENQIEASGQLIAALSMEKGKSIVALAQVVSGSPLCQPLIAHAKAIQINSFLHPKEQGEDANYSMLIGPNGQHHIVLSFAKSGYCKTLYGAFVIQQHSLNVGFSSILRIMSEEWAALIADVPL